MSDSSVATVTITGAPIQGANMVLTSIQPQPRDSGTEVERNGEGKFVKGHKKLGGREQGVRNFTTKVREALEKIAEGKDYTYEEAFIKAILKKAIIEQDATVIKLIWNYLDGMPTQPIDHSGIVGIEKLTNVLKDKMSYADEKRDQDTIQE